MGNRRAEHLMFTFAQRRQQVRFSSGWLLEPLDVDEIGARIRS